MMQSPFYHLPCKPIMEGTEGAPNAWRSHCNCGWYDTTASTREGAFDLHRDHRITELYRYLEKHLTNHKG